MPPTSHTRRIRVATYNVHKCRGLDLKTRPNRIVNVLRKLNADVIALQEVATVQQDQARFIATALGYEFCFGDVRKYKGAPYGNVLLSRLPVRAARNHNITIGHREERGCLQIDLEISEKEVLHVFNVHLGTSYFERRKQAQRLLFEILNSPRIVGPRVILGDFNEWLVGLTTRLLRAHFGTFYRGLLKRGRSYPTLLPLLRLDNIYYDRALILERFLVHKSMAARIASDHLPLVADLLLPAVMKNKMGNKQVIAALAS
jgi:endonuclease/exonuclease/phosphatase family metal-dependent hydrolase